MLTWLCRGLAVRLPEHVSLNRCLLVQLKCQNVCLPGPRASHNASLWVAGGRGGGGVSRSFKGHPSKEMKATRGLLDSSSDISRVSLESRFFWAFPEFFHASGAAAPVSTNLPPADGRCCSPFLPVEADGKALFMASHKHMRERLQLPAAAAWAPSRLYQI